MPLNACRNGGNAKNFLIVKQQVFKFLATA